MSRFFIFISFLLLFQCNLLGQLNFSSATLNDSLQVWGELVLKASDISIRKEANAKFREALLSLLKSGNGFTSDLSQVKTLVKLESPDQLFKLLNWNLPLENGQLSYFCFLVFNPAKVKNGLSYIEFIDQHFTIEKPENKQLKHTQWFGCLYYKLIKTKYKKTDYYTLMGWDGHDNFTNRKIIEVFKFDSRMLPVFGHQVFEGTKRKQHRVIFDYSKEVTMGLNWNDKLDMIVFDHLSPPDDKLLNQFMFYGPDMTYDGFKWEDGKWKYYQTIDVKNFNSNSGNRSKQVEKGLEKKSK